jgi:hypothetical protein
LPNPTDKLTEPRSPHWIALDGDNVDSALGERKSDRTKTRANLDDQLSGPEVSLGDQAFSALGTKEVLTETATPFVSACPQLGGQGGSLP